MKQKNDYNRQCQKILQENGGIIADRASKILFEDPLLKDLHSPLEFISNNWREPLTPSMVSLACEAVGGNSEDTYEPSLALCLMHLSFYVWDDMIDKANLKSFKPTLFGKYGEGPALIIGGLASAKAFSILNQMKNDVTKHQEINKLVWELWAKMAQAEAVNLKLRKQGNVSFNNKLSIIENEASDLATCMEIGAILGNGTKNEVKHLTNYGRFIGILLEFWNSFYVTTNLTVELAEKLKNGTYPLLLLWAMEQSEQLRRNLEKLKRDKSFDSFNIKEIVENVLDAGATEHAKENVLGYSNKAVAELEFFDNDASETLRFFARAQPKAFDESLYPLQI